MNILSNTILGGMKNIMSILSEKYSFDSLYVIQFDYAIKELENFSLGKRVKYIWPWSDVFSARYDDYIYAHDLMPLDKKILDDMAIYEGEALKMFERERSNKDTIENKLIKYNQHIQYWNHVISVLDIKMYFTGFTPHAGYDYIIMRLCQLKNIPVIQEELLPFVKTKRLIIYDSYEKFDDEIVNRINYYYENDIRVSRKDLPEDIKEEYDYFTGDKSARISMGKRSTLSKKMIGYCEAFRRYYRLDKKRTFEKIYLRFQRKQYIKKLLRKYESMTEEVDYSIPYIYFALHYQPELTTSPRGGWYVHQYLAVKMLSYYLPSSMLILVKEHPYYRKATDNTRLLKHYEMMKSLPNVRFVPLDEDNDKLIRNARAVASITGNVGYEAFYKKIPFLMFGNQAMKYSRGTINIRYNEDCEKALNSIEKNDLQITNRDILIFLKALSDVSVMIEYGKKWRTGYSSSRENVSRMVGLYASIIGKYVKK